MIDLVIRGGTVLDGTGGDPMRADVAIEGDRVAAVGEVPPVDAPELDASGLLVTPGFVDVHSHSDYTLLVDPRARSAVHQGVTLEVVGNCGFGCFPIRDPGLARKAIYGYSPDVPVDWSTAGEYFDRLEAARPAVNVASLVPNGQLRLSTVGLADRPAAADEASQMADLLRESLGEGAWGYSTGLEYAQEAAATEEEVTGLCQALAPSGGLYATHTRRRDEGAADSVAEAIRSAGAAGVRLQVSHLVPRNGIEESRRSIELVERARDGGMDIEFDMHTRLYGLTHLYAALPPWALSEQGEALVEPSPRPRGARPDAATPEPAQRRRRLGADRAPRQPVLAAVRAPRPRVGRRRARSGASRRRLRPARRLGRGAPGGDGADPRLHRRRAA